MSLDRGAIRADRLSERDVVVEVVDRFAGGTAAGGGGAGPGGLVAKATAAVAVVVVIAALGRDRTARAVEHRQLAGKSVQHDLGRVALLVLLVGPFARLQRTLD